MKLRDIAQLLNADVEGTGEIDIQRVAKIEDAGEGDLTFVANPKYVKFFSTTRASAAIVGKSFKSPRAGPGPSLLRVEDPYLSFLKVLQVFNPPADPLPPGIHSLAVIDPSAYVGSDVRIGAHVVVGARSRIGDGTVLCPGVVIGDDVGVGDHSILYPNVTVRERCEIGSKVIIHPGATIGSDGFGFAPKADGTYEKIPQLGTVIIEDDVEIGANCTVDRATMGETRIKQGAKLDNLIQIAHNVVVGENTVIAAQAGISGSTRIGRNSMIGGQVGITGHLEIADNTKIGAQSGVHRSIRESGMTYFGYPALPHREAMKLHATLAKLPEMTETLRTLESLITKLETELKALREKTGAGS